MAKKVILIFGLGFLQQSLIARCKAMNLYTIGIDPCENPACKDLVDVFEIVDGHDYKKTLNIAQKYRVSGVITTATDKPLVIMAKIASKLNLPFYSLETATWTTDKLLMKKKFQEFNIPCAKGELLHSFEELKIRQFTYPVIIKPRDNSGSRGVMYCSNAEEVRNTLNETLRYTSKDSVLIEEYIEGKEYSVESIHTNGKTFVLQITEKITTAFPYNVELGHIQPAEISDKIKDKIKEYICRIADALHFENCGSHTELKINTQGIKIIETSPRLGGDFITSALVPLTTGIDMEKLLITISLGEEVDEMLLQEKGKQSAGIVFFHLKEGKILKITDPSAIQSIPGLQSYVLDLKEGDIINKITSSQNRYGYAIFQAKDRDSLLYKITKIQRMMVNNVIIAE